MDSVRETVNSRFERWIEGREYSSEQLEWLMMIKDHIATSLAIQIDDFDYAPFHERGGRMKVFNVFGEELDSILKEINEVLVA